MGDNYNCDWPIIIRLYDDAVFLHRLYTVNWDGKMIKKMSR
jgi:hypothetical protein